MSRQNADERSLEHASGNGSAERRQQRSGEPAVALGLFLDAVRRRHGYSTLAVSDGSGLLVAGSGHFEACEELAARAPLLHKSQNSKATQEAVEAFRIDGVEVLVTGADAATPDLQAVVSGCTRILGTMSPPTLAV